MALERLSDETLTTDQVNVEVDKAKAISQLAGTLIQSAKVEIPYYARYWCGLDWGYYPSAFAVKVGGVKYSPAVAFPCKRIGLLVGLA